MPEYNFWEYVLSPGFLIPFGLVLAGFLPVAYSVFVTWQDNGAKEARLLEKVRAERRRRWEARVQRARSAQRAKSS
ncbi:MAG: hypothetical protein MUE40_05005 [Anaerolineae bacterium]|jgi:hypothetical protein|nr:hypothetical protein [Anaerolineae bacterium]